MRITRESSYPTSLFKFVVVFYPV